ncbi:MAG TPA: hypothetical protein VGM07_02405 [Stellaceae bacterium]
MLGVALAGLGLIRRRKKSDAAPQPPSSLAALTKAGTTSAMKRAISSLTWACSFRPTLK